ncbi:MAG: 30S ribosomal protein S5 [archaeon]
MKKIQKSKRDKNVESGIRRIKTFDIEAWKPKTELGKKVKSGEITDIDQILNQGLKILEPEIVDALLPGLETDLLMIGQSKGKFGGGKRTIWRQTQKKTKEGNKASFATMAVAGNKDGYVGVGMGKAKETVPAREKATRRAKLNIIKIKRGCGSWACGCAEPHSIPFAVKGKCGSVKMQLMTAAKGTGLCIEPECGKLLALAGVKDVYSKSIGQTKTKINHVKACFEALKQFAEIKMPETYKKKCGLVEGKIKK